MALWREIKELRIQNNKHMQTSQTDQAVGEVGFEWSCVLPCAAASCILVIRKPQKTLPFISEGYFTTSVPGDRLCQACCQAQGRVDLRVALM